MRTKLVVGNWKMYTVAATARPLAAAVAQEYAAARPGFHAVVCPPFPYLGTVGAAVAGSGVELGAQDCGTANEGAQTGSVSPAMLADVGCRYVIVGHSERRHGLGETSELVNAKVKAARAAGLRPILCVGETLAERQGDRTESVLEAQLTASLRGVGAVADVVLAYEPVWAIGTGHTATPEQAQAAHAFLRGRLGGLYGADAAGRVPILYGGSVKPDNAAALFAQADVDGGLIGGASLKAEQFLPIVRAGLAVAG